MSNFKIEFAYPWLLLLLVPMVALALFLHFRLDKRFRRTRNRIVSLVLHITVSVLCVAVLSGMTFTYDTDNVDNEMIIVADCSFSGAQRDDEKVEFVHSIIQESNDSYKIGVVTFGYNQVYAAPLDNDSDRVYRNYINSELPDDSATDIASALQFARDKLTHPKTAKIVLVSDGVETDRSALDVIRAIAADGVQINVAYFGNTKSSKEIQIIDAILPQHNPTVGAAFKLGVTLQSSVVGDAKLTLWDNNKEVSSIDVAVEGGVRDLYFDCQFDVGGLHVLRVDVEAAEGVEDGLSENNSYYTYINVENFNKLLIIERTEGESAVLENILTANDDPFDVTVVNIGSDELPYDVDELRIYDQVILNNISILDMPEGFIENLNSYVYDYGGGMFTVGGDRIDDYGDTVPNAYNTDDIKGTLYQDMLPVQVINYTPPVAVMIIIDKSGSMTDSSSTSGQNKIDAAKDGAKAAIRALTSRDYCGIMTLTRDFTVEQSITPVTQYEKLFSIIDSIEAGGGTYYTPSIERAGRILTSVNVERRHIILVSDGLPADNSESYTAAIRRNYENSGITFSVVAIGMGSTGTSNLENAAVDVGHGRFYNIEDTDNLVDKMRDELRVDEIKGVNYEDFVPKLNTSSSVAVGVNPALVPTLGGFYGTRLKDEETVVAPLEGEYVPIFAQWQYGNGKVGSFMCDLSGVKWSKTFVSDNVGKKLIVNMVKALMPTVNIHPQDIDVEFVEDNYTTDISVFTEITDGQKLQVAVSKVLSSEGSDEDSVLTPDAQNGYSRIRVAITEPGLYKITVNKLDAQNKVIGTYSAYRAFSYSKEYDMFYDEDAAEALMTAIAEVGGGEVITGAWQLFTDRKTYIHHVIDPRLAFLIISIVLFLLDIAARKFKWKWIHELVRERKAKKAETAKED